MEVLHFRWSPPTQKFFFTKVENFSFVSCSEKIAFNRYSSSSYLFFFFHRTLYSNCGHYCTFFYLIFLILKEPLVLFFLILSPLLSRVILVSFYTNFVNECDSILSKLHSILRPFVLRRLKSDVESELPLKTESVLNVPLSRRQLVLYNEFLGLSSTQVFFIK